MKITYTAPVRTNYYPLAEAIHRLGHLHKFITGFTRFSPRSALPSIGEKLERHDFFFNIFLASLRLNAPYPITSLFSNLCNQQLDKVSYRWAKESDVFIFYRTQGYYTTKKLHMEKAKTLCIMEEVNCHVDYSHELMEEEFKNLNLNRHFEKYADHDLRLKTYEEADYILCVSDFVRRSFLAKGFSQDRLLKVNFGFPKVEITKAKTYNNDSFRLLFVGQINYRKGLRFAIEAFRRLNHPKKEFFIVGPKTSITGLENTKIPEGVIFTGTLKGEALKEQYKKASVFILPSIEEGQALVQGEALSMGVPLLITTNTGGDDLIRDGIEGFIVPPSNVEVLVSRLQQMADDKSLLMLMSEAALKVSHSLGSWDSAAENLLDQLTSLPIIAR